MIPMSGSSSVILRKELDVRTSWKHISLCTTSQWFSTEKTLRVYGRVVDTHQVQGASMEYF